MTIAGNPGSLLTTKLVKEGYGTAGRDMEIGAALLVRAALSDEFATATGRWFDNDSGSLAPPHPDALDPERNEAVEHDIEVILGERT